MAATQQQLYSAPFDAAAAHYDETFTFSKIGLAQRHAVWSELGKAFHPGDRTLEIGCGTGIDACFLAKRGVRVVACDSSSQMVNIATQRIQEERMQKLVQPLLLPAEQIGALQATELFDGVFSNFGALNCVEDIPGVARDLARLLKPGGSALLCWMGPCCLWEAAWYLAHAKRERAFRRFKPDGALVKVDGGPSVRVRYPTVKYLARTFSPNFHLASIKGIGIAVPPSYVEPWAQRHPNLLRICERTDSLIAKIPGVRVLADHVLLKLERHDDGLGRRRQ